MDFTTATLVILFVALTIFCIARLIEPKPRTCDGQRHTPPSTTTPPHVARSIVAQLPPITPPAPKPTSPSTRGPSLPPRREPSPERWAAVADPATEPQPTIHPRPTIQPLTFRHLAIYRVTRDELDTLGKN